MRIPASMLRWLSAGIFFLVFLFFIVTPAIADTGTYGISSYIVTMEPREDGQVKIAIEQSWRVLSGHIPWVTVGLPNRNFSIEDHGAAASKVEKSSSGGFTGVRIDLDKDYQSGEGFKIQFTVIQNNLLERLPDENIWRIDYTPGWYDRATIDHLQIKLVSPVDIQSYSSLNPSPTDTRNNVITWDKYNLKSGERFRVRMESIDGSFLAADVVTGSSGTGGSLDFISIFFIVIILGIGFFVVWRIRKNRRRVKARVYNRIMEIEAEMAKDETKKKEIEQGFNKYIEEKNLQPDDEGRYYVKKHGYISPAIWAAVISPQYHYVDRPYVHPYIGTGSRGPTCVACACVACACACACACAGGGAAGCSRKTLHECPLCKESADKTNELADNTDSPVCSRK